MTAAWRCAALALAVSCSDAAQPEPPEPGPIVDVGGNAATAVAAPDNCGTLGERAREDDASAAVFVVLCPETPLDPLQARAALRSIHDPVAATRIAPRLREHAELHALARLVALDGVPPLAASQLPEPQTAVVTPIDDDVLSHAQLARSLRFSSDASPDQRTKARAYLAKVFIRALQQLGTSPRQPPPPVGRLLAARVLDHGQRFVVAYWRRRVAGLRPLFDVTEDALVGAVQTLEAGPHHGDAPGTALEHHRARRWIERDGPRQRIADRVDDTAILPLANELQRLTEHGFVDLAVEHATGVSGLSKAAALELVAAALAHAERDADADRLRARIDRLRAEEPPAVDVGPTPLAVPQPSSWPSADAVAESIASDLAVLPEEGFGRHVTLAYAAIELQRRPDALRLLVDRLTSDDAPAKLRVHASWIAALVDAVGEHTPRWLRRKAALDATSPTEVGRDELEARRRRAFAVAARSGATSGE